MKQFGGPENRRRRKPPDLQGAIFFGGDREEVLKAALASTHLSVRCVNALETGGLHTIGDLAEATHERLLELRNFGGRTLEECREFLDDLDIPHPRWDASSM